MTDHKTGLIWQRADDETMRAWSSAQKYCGDLVLGGKADWRLPRIDELETIIDYSQYGPGIDPVFDCHSDNYWSSSSYVNDPANAWSVLFDGGEASSDNKGYNGYYVRCVRGGPQSVPAYTVPGAPTGATAVAGNAQATVSFTAPASDGGSPITSYTVTSSPGGVTATGTSSPITVTGLTNGTAYTFTATATNAMGTGPASSPSNSVTPVGSAAVPGAPTGVTAVAGNASATVSFTAPASNGGSAITSYTVTSSPGGISASGAASPITMTGLTNWAAYTFTVTATNAAGTGPASSTSNSVTPADPATSFSVSGRVATSGGTGVSGVTMTFSLTSGSTVVPGTMTTDSDGYWTQWGFAIGPSYRVTPSLDNNNFIPGSIDFTAERSDLNFTFTLRYVNNWDGTVTDNNTGLMWQKGDDGVVRGWADAGQYCENLVFGGYDDWRFPRIDELETIVNYNRFRPANDPVFDSRSSNYWSSSTSASNPDHAWLVGFEYGHVSAAYETYNNFYVRCVRGRPFWPFDPSTHLQTPVGKPNTVLDTYWGYMWQKGDSGSVLTWAQGKAYCDGLELDGYTDWRLPEIEALQTIVDYTQNYPALSTIFDPRRSGNYWSSSTYVYDPVGVWYVNFSHGDESAGLKTYFYCVRCVRSGH